MDPSSHNPPPSGVSGRRVVLLGLALFLGLGGLWIVGRLTLPRVVEAGKQKSRAQCAVNLRRVGGAAEQYASSARNRTFPHIRRLDVLDGDPTTSDTPRVFRSMARLGYLEDPATLSCPNRPRPSLTREEREAQQAWLMGGEGQTPTLMKCEALSYGWTRRGLKGSVPGTTLLAADKAVVPHYGPEGAMRGNHTDGWSVVRADGVVEFLTVDADPYPGSYLAKTQEVGRDGFLAILDQDDPRIFTGESK